MSVPAAAAGVPELSQATCELELLPVGAPPRIWPAGEFAQLFSGSDGGEVLVVQSQGVLSIEALAPLGADAPRLPSVVLPVGSGDPAAARRAAWAHVRDLPPITGPLPADGLLGRRLRVAETPRRRHQAVSVAVNRAVGDLTRCPTGGGDLWFGVAPRPVAGHALHAAVVGAWLRRDADPAAVGAVVAVPAGAAGLVQMLVPLSVHLGRRATRTGALLAALCTSGYPATYDEFAQVVRAAQRLDAPGRGRAAG